ncbi:MAG: DUF697 domain-containing protein [Magnetococcales bacterium]|nr:DUF697 domain-containing protein [Magnetococcales bacterium]
MFQPRDHANATVRNHSFAAAGFGLIPVVGADMVAVGGAQLNMIHSLTKIYGVPFSQERARAIISALLGGVLPYAIESSTLGSAVKSIPLVGSVLGMAVMPGLSAVTTLIIGRIFVRHFEAGGTLLDMDQNKMREYYRQQFEQAKEDVEQVMA